MSTNQTAWDSFLETGKIDDYLKYCQDRKQQMYVSATGGAEATNATDSQWDCPAGLQNRRG